MNIKYFCPKCEKFVDVSVTFDTPGNISGPPEDCYPDEPGYIEPDTCDCGAKLDEGNCQEQAIKEHQDMRDDVKIEEYLDRKVNYNL